MLIEEGANLVVGSADALIDEDGGLAPVGRIPLPERKPIEDEPRFSQRISIGHAASGDVSTVDQFNVH
jgi:hypothetical protein